MRYRKKLIYRKYENLRTTLMSPLPLPLLPTLPPLVGSPALRNTGWLGGFRENRGGGSRTTSYKSIASPPAVQSQPRTSILPLEYDTTYPLVTRQTETIIKRKREREIEKKRRGG